MTDNKECKSTHKNQRLRWICNECGKEFPLEPYEKLDLLRDSK